MVHGWTLGIDGLLRRPSGMTDKREAEYRARFQRSIERDVRRFAESFAKPDLECRVHVEEGRTAHVVTESAKRLEADLIGMGPVARTRIPGFIIGNTAEEVLADVHCSVLAVKPPDFRTPVTLEGE